MSGQDLNLELVIKARGDQARAEIAATSASVQGMQTEAAAASSRWAQQLQADAAAWTAAKQTEATASEAAAASTEKLAKSVEDVGRVSPVALNEFRALFDELSSGRAYRSPGTIAIIAQKVFGLSTGALLAGGSIVGLGIALGYVTVKAIEASNAIDRIGIGAAFAGNLNLTSQEIKRVSDETGAGATQIEAVLARMGNMSSSVFEGLTISASEYARAMGVKGPQAAKALSGAIDSTNLSVAKLQQLFPGLTEEEAQNFLAIQRTGNAHQTAAALIDLVQSRMEQARSRVISYDAGWTSLSNDIRLGAAALQTASLGTIQLSTIIEGVIRYWRVWLADLKDGYHWVAKYAQSLGIADQEQAVHNRLIQEATKSFDAKHWKSMVDGALALAHSGSGASKLAEAIKLSADSSAAKIDQLRAHIKLLKQEMSNSDATSADKLNFASKIADYQKQLSSLTSSHGTNYMQAARDQLSQLEESDQVSDDKRLGFELDFWKKKLAALSAGSKEYGQVLRTAQSLQREIDARQAAQAKQDLDAELQATVTAARAQVSQKRSILQQEVQLGQISTQQEIAQEKDLENQLYAIELKALQDRLKLENLRPAQRKRINEEIEALEKQHDLKMKDLNNKGALAAQQAWEKALQPISQAFDQTVRGMIQGTQSFQQGMANILDSIVMEFANMEVETLVKHIATEAAKTTATASGASQRTAIQATAKSQSLIMSAESGLKEILNSAWSAAAAAFKATAGIPVIGPILAPAAGAAAFAAVAAMGGNIASAAGGYWELPSDQMIMAHEREMVIPARFAEGLRGLIENGRTAQNGPSHTSITAVDAESFARLMKRNPGAVSVGVRSMLRNGAF